MYGLTPIELARNIAFIEAIDRIASLKKTPAGDLYNYGSPLLDACVANNENLAITLLQAGAKDNWSKGDTGHYALHGAVVHNNPNLITQLLEHGADYLKQNKRKLNAFELAIELQHHEAIEAFLQHKEIRFDKTLSVYSMSYNLLIAALITQHNSIAERYILAGSMVNAPAATNELTPLHLAITQDHSLALIACLLKHGASLTAQANYKTPLEYACELQRWQEAELMLKHASACDAEFHYDQALYYAVLHGNYTLAKLLLKQGASAKQENCDTGNILLNIAITIKRIDIVQLLLDYDADPDIKNKAGHISKDVALNEGFYEAIPLLLLHRVPILQTLRHSLQQAFQETWSMPPIEWGKQLLNLNTKYSAVLNCLLAYFKQERESFLRNGYLKGVESCNYVIAISHKLLQFQTLSIEEQYAIYSIQQQAMLEVSALFECSYIRHRCKNFIDELQAWLRNLKKNVAEESWFKRDLFGLWEEAFPRNIGKMAKILGTLNALTEEVYWITAYADIVKLLREIKPNTNRHFKTTQFYKQLREEISKHTFPVLTVSSPMLSVAPSDPSAPLQTPLQTVSCRGSSSLYPSLHTEVLSEDLAQVSSAAVSAEQMPTLGSPPPTYAQAIQAKETVATLSGRINSNTLFALPLDTSNFLKVFPTTPNHSLESNQVIQEDSVDRENSGRRILLG